MILAYLTLITALVISAVAIYYSVAGLAAIFAAAVIPIIIMGVALEIGKLVTAVWLHKYWKQAAWWLKTYLSVAVVVLMFITSMGIFGFLSKAHIDQTATAGDNSLQVQLIEQRISREQKRITDADLVISQLDKAVQVLLDNDRIRGNSGAIAVRESQKNERASLNEIINDAQNNVAKLQDEKLVLEKEQVAIEAEVGPIKYIAEFIYGDTADKNMLEEAVRWVIVILIFVFDPLAILLLIAAQYTFQFQREMRNVNIEGEKDELVQEETPPEGTGEETPLTSQPVVGTTDAGSIEQSQTNPELSIRDVEAEEASKKIEEINESIPHHPDTHPYLREGFGKGFENLQPMVAKQDDAETKEKDDDEHTRLTADELEELESSEEWQKAKTAWKEDNPNVNLKFFKNLYLEGKINKLPWEDYLKDKKSYIMKDGNQQVKKVIQASNIETEEASEGYIQNEEQKEKGIWKKIRPTDE